MRPNAPLVSLKDACINAVLKKVWCGLIMALRINNIEQANSLKDSSVAEFLKNNIGLEVLTDTGWSHFDGLQLKGHQDTVVVRTTKSSIICTANHEFYTDSFNKIRAAALRPGNKLVGKSGLHRVVSVTVSEPKAVYDLLNVKKNHRFYANNILVSNCEFIIFDETLINPIALAEMAGIEPIERQGQVRWYKKPKKGGTYVVGLDPSLGTGGDYAAIEVFELPHMEQVAEWQHNKTPVQGQIRILQEITKYLVSVTENPNDVYYSVENNTLGEAALVVISEIGEENINGIFLTEPKRPGQGRLRKGFITTNKTKLAACAKFKALVEGKKMKLASNNLISQLKNFVANGTSYAAKIGENDDLVMAVMLCVRMAQFLREFDPSLDDTLKDHLDDYDLPMPFIMI